MPRFTRKFSLLSLLLTTSAFCLVVAHFAHRTQIQNAAVQNVMAHGGRAFSAGSAEIDTGFFPNLINTVNRVEFASFQGQHSLFNSLEDLIDLECIKFPTEEGHDCYDLITKIRTRLPMVDIDNCYADLLEIVESSGGGGARSITGDDVNGIFD